MKPDRDFFDFRDFHDGSPRTPPGAESDRMSRPERAGGPKPGAGNRPPAANDGTWLPVAG
jgi:hypothetical protein